MLVATHLLLLNCATDAVAGTDASSWERAVVVAACSRPRCRKPSKQTGGLVDECCFPVAEQDRRLGGPRGQPLLPNDSRAACLMLRSRWQLSHRSPITYEARRQRGSAKLHLFFFAGCHVMVWHMR